MRKRKIPPKNYIILFGVIVLIICACFALNNLYRIAKENSISNSPLSTKEVLYDDLKATTVEMDADTFLVVSYVGNEEVHKNEKAIKKVLSKKNLIDNIMYLDITGFQSDEEYLNDLNKTLKLDGKLRIKQYPAVVYYKEGVPTLTVDSREQMLSANDFEQIIDMYELAN